MARKNKTQDQLLQMIAAKHGWIFIDEAAAHFGKTKLPFTKPNGKSGLKTIGEGEWSFALHTQLPTDSIQGTREPFDFKTPFGRGEGKKEAKLKFQPNAAGRRAKSDFEAEMNARSGERNGADFHLQNIFPRYRTHESITRQHLIQEVQSDLPEVLSILDKHTRPSVVLGEADFMTVFFNRKGVTGFILVPASEYDVAFEFVAFTRGSTTYKLRLEWLEMLL